MSLAAEIALQMKTSLSFLLGLGAMFSMAKSGLSSYFTLADVPEKITRERPLISRHIRGLKGKAIWCILLMGGLFILACILYFGPLDELDVARVQETPINMTTVEVFSIYSLCGIAILFVALDLFLAIQRQRITTLIQTLDK